MKSADFYDPDLDFFKDVTFTLPPSAADKRQAVRTRRRIAFALCVFWTAAFVFGFMVFG